MNQWLRAITFNWAKEELTSISMWYLDTDDRLLLMIWRRCMIYPFWGWWYKIISVLLLIYYWFWAVTDSSSALDSSSMVWWLISGWCICSLYSILIKSSNYYNHNILDIYDYAYILVTQQHFNISLAVKRSYKEIISSSSLGCLQARSSSLLSFGCYRSLA